MRWVWSLLIAAFALTPSYGQMLSQNPPAPQTAREALLEMLSNKTPDAFEKHLPEAAKRALIRKGDDERTSVIRQFSGAAMAMAAQGGRFQTFEAGPILLSVEEKGGRQKFEVTVDGDDLQGDEDRMELSFHAYKDGEPEALPVVPRLVLTMKQEKDIWRVNEISVNLHVPLTDPDYLKGLQRMQNDAYESYALMRVRTVIGAETTYAAAHPERGYTCRLKDLMGAQQGDPALASGEGNGFKFALSGCDSVPSSKYRVTAVPSDIETGAKAFCANESGVVRYAEDGTAATCWREGEIVK